MFDSILCYICRLKVFRAQFNNQMLNFVKNYVGFIKMFMIDLLPAISAN